MPFENFTLPQLARYLRRDARDLQRLADQGRLPGRRVGGQWTVHRSEVHHWLETTLPDLSADQLETLEEAVTAATPDGAVVGADAGLVVTPMTGVDFIAAPLQSRSPAGVLQELVEKANASWQVYDPAKVLAAVREREALASTAQVNGVALPHPGRRLPDAIGETVVAVGVSPGGVYFGAPNGGKTDVFFLILATENQKHLQVLARLGRLLLAEDFLGKVRAAEGPAAVVNVLRETELAVAGDTAA